MLDHYLFNQKDNNHYWKDFTVIYYCFNGVLSKTHSISLHKTEAPSSFLVLSGVWHISIAVISLAIQVGFKANVTPPKKQINVQG